MQEMKLDVILLFLLFFSPSPSHFSSAVGVWDYVQFHHALTCVSFRGTYQTTFASLFQCQFLSQSTAYNNWLRYKLNGFQVGQWLWSSDTCMKLRTGFVWLFILRLVSFILTTCSCAENVAGCVPRLDPDCICEVRIVALLAYWRFTQPQTPNYLC